MQSWTASHPCSRTNNNHIPTTSLSLSFYLSSVVIIIIIIITNTPSPANTNQPTRTTSYIFQSVLPTCVTISHYIAYYHIWTLTTTLSLLPPALIRYSLPC